MLRFIIRKEYTGHVVYGGATKADTKYETFDIDIPELEKILSERQDYFSVNLDGVEVKTKEDASQNSV